MPRGAGEIVPAICALPERPFMRAGAKQRAVQRHYLEPTEFVRNISNMPVCSPSVAPSARQRIATYATSGTRCRAPRERNFSIERAKRRARLQVFERRHQFVSIRRMPTLMAFIHEPFVCH